LVPQEQPHLPKTGPPGSRLSDVAVVATQMRPDGVQDTNDMVATSKDLALDSDVILGFFRCESHEFATLIYYNLFEGCALHVIG